MPAGEPNDSSFIWGPEINGLDAAVEFVPEKEVYTQGEIIGIVFHIRNISGHRIQFTTSVWRQDIEGVIEDFNGKVIQCNHNWYSGLPHIIRIVLDPCEVSRIESSSFGVGGKRTKDFKHPVGSWVQLEPGRYLLHYKLRFPDIRSTAFPSEPDDWTGILETGKRLLIVKAAEKEPNSPGK